MIESASGVDWTSLRAVVLDVDGTLYDQRRLRARMALRLASHYLTRPWTLNDLYILYRFRKTREALADSTHSKLDSTQYSVVAERLGCSMEKVRSVVEKWIYREPLPYLKECKYPGVDGFIDVLRRRDVEVAFLSDYPLSDKLEAMGIRSDRVYCATDPSIDRLKPSPKGLSVILGELGLHAGECLMIGDRYERDGVSAESLGMRYLIIGKGDRGFFPGLVEELKRL
jgi:FMN phosphatase YigB (HAD superfamily)